MSVRAPYAAGLFYLGYESGLRREVQKLLTVESDVKKHKAQGVVVPHAGYEYSGKTAGAVYGSIVIPKRLIILGPNHSGFGRPISIDNHDAWRTPLGDAQLDKELIEELSQFPNVIEINRDAHRLEHSIEVQLPFIQVLLGNDFSFVPIAMMGGPGNSSYEEIGKTIAQVVNSINEDILIIASTDFTHYEPLNYAREMDAKAIHAIEDMDPEGLLKTVYENDITMCGYGPVATMMFAAIELGATKAKLISYTSSAAFSMDESSVVGYGGLIIE